MSQPQRKSGALLQVAERALRGRSKDNDDAVGDEGIVAFLVEAGSKIMIS
jgi:hypothetical protein